MYYVWSMACITCEFVNSTFFVVWCFIGILGFVSWCNVVAFLKAMPMWVCSNKLVIFLTFGLVQIFLSFSFSSVCVWSILCFICRFNFCRRFCGELLFLAIVCIIFHSFCFFFGSSGIEYILEMWYLKATILCSVGWFERSYCCVGGSWFSVYVHFEICLFACYCQV